MVSNEDIRREIAEEEGFCFQCAATFDYKIEQLRAELAAKDKEIERLRESKNRKIQRLNELFELLEKAEAKLSALQARIDSAEEVSIFEKSDGNRMIDRKLTQSELKKVNELVSDLKWTV